VAQAAAGWSNVNRTIQLSLVTTLLFGGPRTQVAAVLATPPEEALSAAVEHECTELLLAGSEWLEAAQGAGWGVEDVCEALSDPSVWAGRPPTVGIYDPSDGRLLHSLPDGRDDKDAACNTELPSELHSEALQSLREGEPHLRLSAGGRRTAVRVEAGLPCLADSGEPAAVVFLSREVELLQAMKHPEHGVVLSVLTEAGDLLAETATAPTETIADPAESRCETAFPSAQRVSKAVTGSSEGSAGYIGFDPREKSPTRSTLRWTHGALLNAAWIATARISVAVDADEKHPLTGRWQGAYSAAGHRLADAVENWEVVQDGGAALLAIAQDGSYCRLYIKVGEWEAEGTGLVTGQRLAVGFLSTDGRKEGINYLRAEYDPAKDSLRGSLVGDGVREDVVTTLFFKRVETPAPAKPDAVQGSGEAPADAVEEQSTAVSDTHGETP